MMRILRKITLLITVALALVAWSLTSWASLPAPGRPAPNFLVESGDSRKLTLDMVRGKVVVLFYETRHVIKKNLALKNELKHYYRVQPANIQNDVFRLVVIDCSESTWPTLPIWKSQLREHSRKEGFTIFGDWNRQMCTDYHMQAGDSNFLIIDKHGLIRYAATGKVDPGQFEKIKELLFTLVQAG